MSERARNKTHHENETPELGSMHLSSGSTCCRCSSSNLWLDGWEHFRTWLELFVTVGSACGESGWRITLHERLEAGGCRGCVRRQSEHCCAEQQRLGECHCCEDFLKQAFKAPMEKYMELSERETRAQDFVSFLVMKDGFGYIIW